MSIWRAAPASGLASRAGRGWEGERRPMSSLTTHPQEVDKTARPSLAQGGRERCLEQSEDLRQLQTPGTQHSLLTLMGQASSRSPLTEETGFLSPQSIPLPCTELLVSLLSGAAASGWGGSRSGLCWVMYHVSQVPSWHLPSASSYTSPSLETPLPHHPNFPQQPPTAGASSS